MFDEWLDYSPMKFQTQQYNPHIVTFCNIHNLLDCFTHPVLKEFSWVKPALSCRSKIDFWLISDYINDFVAECSVSAAPLTDHCSINLTLKPTDTCKRNKGYWKFNASLLYSETYCQEVKSIIKEVSDTLSSYRSKFEFLKFRIRNFSISFSLLAK